jgi:hypothetical protein
MNNYNHKSWKQLQAEKRKAEQDNWGAIFISVFIVFCIAFWLFLGYLEIKAETSGRQSYNNLCNNSLQVGGYCCDSIEQFQTGNCTQ